MAARGAGLDLSRDWGRISAERARDPVLHAVLSSAERAQRDRIAAKAAQVAESALDGEQVTREAARLAALLLKDDGTSAARVAPGTAPQVVINITDGASFNLARDNPLQGSAGNVIDM